MIPLEIKVILLAGLFAILLEAYKSHKRITNLEGWVYSNSEERLSTKEREVIDVV